MASLIGMMLGNYRVLKIIGKGGMGEVYLAEDVRLNRQVAIKVLRVENSELDNGREATRLFEREAKAIATLDHPNILPLFEYGEQNSNGISLTYLVMPYRQEGSLANWLQLRRSSTPLTPQDVAHLVIQAANALQFAHDHQIIHRDVKPSNFLITNDRGDNPNRPNLQLADFGIAKLTTVSVNTGTNIIGTPHYMAPEQWQGEPVPATDQYALAIMAYELLVGHPPFKGRLDTMLFEHLHTQPVSPSKFNPAISTNIDQVILRALAKSPSDRFDSIAKFAQALERASQSQPKLLPFSSPPQIRSTSSEKNSPIPSTQQALSPEQLAQLRAQLSAGQPLPSDNATGYGFLPPPPPNSANITYSASARPEQSSSPFRGLLMAVLAVLMAIAHLITTFIQVAYKWFQQQVVPRVKSFIRLVNLWFRQQVIPRFKSPVSSVSGKIQQQVQPSTITSYTISPNLLPNPSTLQFTESKLPPDELKDFFISYNRKDEEIAEWIAWQLEEAGYSTIMPKWDFRPGSNFEMEMRKARAKTKRTIVVLSPDYLKARNSMAEWSHVLQQHTAGGQDILLPICVRDCGPKLKKLLGSMVYIDLVGRDRPKALEILLAHVRGERIKPKIEPEYVMRATTEPANLADILFATINLSNPRKPKDADKAIPAAPVVDTPAKVFTREQNKQQSVPDTPKEAAQHQQTPIPVEQQVEQTVRRTRGFEPSKDQQADTEPIVKSTESAAKGIEIFFSYSHKDEELRNELDEHLSTLKQLKLITAWHDKEIGAGKNWAHEIDKRMSKACIILLLVSPSFIASRYCYSVEMKKAMERHEAGEAHVIPILIRPVDWEDTPFDKLQMLPKGAKAVTKWLNRDEAFEDIAKSIRAAVNELNATIPNHS